MASELVGKSAVVTGASSGIGKEIAKGLAQRGASVVLVSSNPKKGEQTLAELRSQLPNAELSYLQADLSKRSEVERLARALEAKVNASTFWSTTRRWCRSSAPWSTGWRARWR